MTKKHDYESEIAENIECYVEHAHLDINSKKDTIDGKLISEWLELIVNIQSRNAVLTEKVAQLEAELATKRGYSNDEHK